MFHKQAIRTAAILLVILLIGCVPRTANTTPRVVNYHTGTDGLTVSFLANQPPSTVTKDRVFTIGLELKNKGAWPINNGEIRIFGIDNPAYFETDETKAAFNLPGRGDEYPEGGYEIITFLSKNIAMPLSSPSKYPVGIEAMAQYEYGTEATASVCINPQRVPTFVKSVCEEKPISMTGQGAPVAVTKVETSVNPIDAELGRYSVDFKITVANKGKGVLAQDMVILNEAILGETKLSCTENKVSLKKGANNQFRCSTEIEAGGAYISPLQIKLTYVYIQKFSKSLEIVK